jgi:EpsI family protein
MRCSVISQFLQKNRAMAHEQPARPPHAFSSAVTIALLLIVGGFGWWLYLRPASEVDPRTIERTASDMAGWKGMDIPISDSVERILRADAHVQRIYENQNGEFVALYVGYYGTRRGGRPEHTPWMCYPAAGWRILAATKRPFVTRSGIPGVADPNPVAGEMNELVVELGADRDLVRFWYSTHRSPALATETALTLDHVIGRFSPTGRADGALVRISTPIDEGGIEAARDRLERFSDPLTRELRHHWPGARPEPG